MNKLKYRLVKFEKALIFQVLEQDARFLRRTGNNLVFTAANGVNIYSGNNPAIVGGGSSVISQVHLRGASGPDYDLIVANVAFATNDMRDAAAAAIHTALADWAKNWPGFTPITLPQGNEFEMFTI